MDALPNPRFADTSDDELAAAIANTDNRFRTWTGAIDLLEMSRQMVEPFFRLYIDASREFRRRIRAQSPQSVNPE